MNRLFTQIDQAAQNFTGVISIFKDNTPVYNRAFGFRDVGNKLPNETTTQFGIASGTKLITALGIGVLIDQGKLKMDTKISDISIDFAGFIGKNATILHLLSHTSGVYDYLDEETIEDYTNVSYDIPWYKLETPMDYLPLFQNHAMKFLPGERFSYSNGGYVLLGMIIEKTTNELYRDFVKKHVLNPAGMTTSGFFTFNELPYNTAQGYLEDRRTTNIYRMPIRGGGDGGMYTTTEDLVHLWNSLFSYKIVSKELTHLYLKPHCSINDKTDYGCGIYIGKQRSCYFIVGGDAGVGFDSRFYPEENVIVNILSNTSDGENEMRRIIREYFA